MKARIIREPRCALLWRIDESYPNYAAIERAAKRYEVKLRRVADGDLGGIVGDLCAGKPAPAAAPLSLLCRTARPLLSAVCAMIPVSWARSLTLCRQAARPFRCAAWSRPPAKGWMLANLLLELNTEHETVQGEKA